MNQQLLVIDDSEQIQSLIRAILAKEDVDIHSAIDPHYGLTLAASVRPDLILLDIDMPGLDGFNACKKLKSDPATEECPVIFLTAHAETKEKVHGFGLGAVDYITKPFNPSELLARVKASLRTHRAIRSLEEQAWIDPLTKLGNRAMFDQRLKAEYGLRVRFAHPLSLIMLDVDDFKFINDTYGHVVGDQVLQAIGKIVSDLCRSEDVACRFGGEEFAILAPHTTAADASILAERICKVLANTPIKPAGLASHATDKTIRVTASLGVAEATDRYDKSILERADFAMYRAKEAGRNQVSIATPSAQTRTMAA